MKSVKATDWICNKEYFKKSIERSS